MALASNHREQMANKLKRSLDRLAPAFTVSRDNDANGDPVLTLNNGADVAVMAIKRRSFAGFNVVAELSESSAEGLPEHISWLIMDNSTSLADQALFVKLITSLGSSEAKVGEVAGAPDAADLIETNVSITLPNDSEVGSAGQ